MRWLVQEEEEEQEKEYKVSYYFILLRERVYWGISNGRVVGGRIVFMQEMRITLMHRY